MHRTVKSVISVRRSPWCYVVPVHYSAPFDEPWDPFIQSSGPLTAGSPLGDALVRRLRPSYNFLLTSINHLDDGLWRRRLASTTRRSTRTAFASGTARNPATWRLKLGLKAQTQARGLDQTLTRSWPKSDA